MDENTNTTTNPADNAGAAIATPVDNASTTTATPVSNTNATAATPSQDVTEQTVIDKFGANAIDQWKKQYAPRQLNVVAVEDAIAVLRPVNAKEIGDYSMMVSDSNVGLEKATRYLISELWLGGDVRILNDEEYFISAMMQSQKIIELKKSTFFRL